MFFYTLVRYYKFRPLKNIHSVYNMYRQVQKSASHRNFSVSTTLQLNAVALTKCIL